MTTLPNLDDWDFPPVNITETYVADLKDSPTFTAEEEWRLAETPTPEAKDALVRSCLPLVLKVAKGFGEIIGLDYLDLVGIGNLGLLRAAKQFRPGFGSFTTFAYICVRRAIRDGIAQQSRNLHIPRETVVARAKVQATQEQLHTQLKRPPTFEELLEATGLEREKLVVILTLMTTDSLSISTSYDDEEPQELIDTIPQNSFPDPQDVLDYRTDVGLLRAALEALTVRQQQVVAARFGLDGSAPATQSEIAKRFGVSVEAISRAERRALAKLRHPKFGLADLFA